MKYLSFGLLGLAALALQPTPARAAPMTFVGNLSGANGAPPVPTPATGTATVVLDPTAQTLQVNATFSGLTSNDTAAHIHCCAPLGTNAGVATTPTRVSGLPFGSDVWNVQLHGVRSYTTGYLQP